MPHIRDGSDHDARVLQKSAESSDGSLGAAQVLEHVRQENDVEPLARDVERSVLNVRDHDPFAIAARADRFL